VQHTIGLQRLMDLNLTLKKCPLEQECQCTAIKKESNPNGLPTTWDRMGLTDYFNFLLFCRLWFY